jgi:hypothetical protein
VRPSPTQILRYQTSTPNRIVIPPVPACRRTGAKRSGGTCRSSSAETNFNESATLPFVIPSEAEGSAVRPPPTQILRYQTFNSKQTRHPPTTVGMTILLALWDEYKKTQMAQGTGRRSIVR